MTLFYVSSARKPIRCDCCFGNIPQGGEYVKATYMASDGYRGYMWRSHVCCGVSMFKKDLAAGYVR